MVLVEVLIERSVNALNRHFTYRYPFLNTIKKGVRVIVNFNKVPVIGFVCNVKEVDISKEGYEESTGFNLYDVVQVIDKEPILNDELLSLADLIANNYLCTKISVLQTMLPPSLKPKYSSLKAPKIKYQIYVKVLDKNEDGLTPKEKEILRLIGMNNDVLKKDIKSKSVLKNLISKSRVEEYKVEENRFKLPDFQIEKNRVLNKDQKNAVEIILNGPKTVTLLEGVTGSGKTEVYLKVSEEILKNNKKVLMLVSEISLTSSMVTIFLKRFGKKVAVLHSELTPAEKYDEYRRIARGDASIVVGARSAIFAPLNNIGLIILDEEHVESYKQDNPPCYHARDIAILRAKLNKAKVLLGSATPLLETKARAIKGIYNYAKLDKRINEKPLPKTYIVDMLQATNLSKESRLFSKLLIDKIKDRLEKKEQIILLLNRRGYANSIMCRDCRETIKCPNCGIPLSQHLSDNLLKCHYCDYVMEIPLTCPSCGSKYLSKVGFGTERVEKEICRIFPNANVLRLDSDIGNVRNNISKTIMKFHNQEADILIGTQMIAKGHDFPNVTLVGVVLADAGLSIPNFRNTETTFNLLTQAIGRSGRDKKEGEAIIQTYLPNHYTITLSSEQDFDEFYKKEMSVRKASQYPPYTFLILLTIKSKNEDLLNDICLKVISDIKLLKLNDVKVLGPTIPYVPYKDKKYIKNILLKYKTSKDDIKKYLTKLLKTLQNKSNIEIIINVDPFSC